MPDRFRQHVADHPELYSELMDDKSVLLARLDHPIGSYRQAALLICKTHWKLRSEPFASKYLTIAKEDPDESVRICAIRVIGELWSGTIDSQRSIFLAKLILAEDSGDLIRQSSYLALREVHLGLTTSLRNAQHALAVRRAARLPNARHTEAEMRESLALAGFLQPSAWDCLESIDWNFVHQCALA